MPIKSKRQDTILHDTPRPVVLTTNLILKHLFNTNRLAFNEFVKKCRNPEHRMSANTLETCQRLSLMNGDSVHELTKKATLFLVDTPGSHFTTKEAQTCHHEADGDDAAAAQKEAKLFTTPQARSSSDLENPYQQIVGNIIPLNFLTLFKENSLPTFALFTLVLSLLCFCCTRRARSASKSQREQTRI